MIDDTMPRVEALAEYYGRVEAILADKVRWSRGKYPITPGTNRNSPVSLWLSCADADAIIEGAGLQNPLFEDEKERE